MAAYASSRLAWLALLCVLWHAVLPVAHAATARSPLLADLCSHQGTTAVPIAPQDGNTHALAALQCPLCLTGNHAAALPSPPTEPARPAAIDLGPAYAAAGAAGDFPAPAHLHFSSRAPPA